MLFKTFSAAALVPAVWSRTISPLARRDDVTQKPLRPGFPVPNPTVSYWQDPPHSIANLRTTPELPTDETFDYVIVGSGVSGASVALKLLDQDPALSILMLEARSAASGATGRNGGHCRPGSYKTLPKWIDAYGEDEGCRIAKLEQDSIDDMRAFVHKYNVSSGWADVESADLYFTKAAFEAAVEVVDLQRELEARRPDDLPKGNDRTVYAGQEARDHWRWPEILGAITFTAHTQNPYLTVCAMLEVSLGRGLNLQTNTVALGLSQLSEDNDAAKWEVETDRGTVRGKQVVLATNGFTPALHPGFASTGFLTPDRNQATAVHPSAYSPENPVFHRSSSYPDLHSGNNYIVVRPPGSLGQGDVIYGGGKKFSPTREANLTDDSVLNEDIRTHLEQVGRVVYGYANWGDETEVLHNWTGICASTPDGLPAVGQVPGEDGLWAIVGMNGHGMAWAHRSAEALVQEMTTGETPEWFPAAFRAGRAWE